uniref:Integrase catalytic domain-containing protein n=1 Tax=Vitis vinifera TaxID=29760 RepID=A5ATL3_VITVI|nr:hypothetical protein VITISV_019749 [Vitis vinifera]
MAETTKLLIHALGTFPGNLNSKELKVQTRSARFRRCSKRAAKSLRSKWLISHRCEVVFQLAVFGFQRDGKLQGEIHSTVQKGCEIISQQKGDFAALCKILLSAWSDRFLFASSPCILYLLMAKDFKALVLHVSELSIALPWIPNNSPQSQIALKSIRGSIVADHLASLAISDGKAIDDDFPYEAIAAVTSFSGWRMYFDAAANHFGHGIYVLLISPHGDHIPRSIRLGFSYQHPTTNNIVEYETCILGLETTDCASIDQVMRGVHTGVCGPHMGRHMLALWGIDIIGKISLKFSSCHEFILVAIDYFTKWVEATSYARLMSFGFTSFIISHIICHYGVPHELISYKGVHFRVEVDTLLQRYGATPYFLVYGMEVVLPVEIEMGSLRVALEQQILEANWAQAQLDQLNLLDERRLRAVDHVHAY